MSVAPAGGGSSTASAPPPPAARLPGYDGAAGPVSPAEKTKVDAAVGQIRHDLSNQGFIGHDRNDHMHDVVKTLNGLTPAERDAVVSQLSDSDLKSLAGNVDHGGIGGIQGLSSDEKKDVFNTLAGSLSGPQLARVSQAFHDPGEVAALAQSVATFSSNATKAEFVAAMAGKVADQKTGDTSTPFLSGTTTTQLGDPDAKAVGTVLASLKGDGANFDKAVGSLSDSQLEAVVKSSAGQTMTTVSGYGGGASVTNTYDPKTLTGLIDAAATAGDPAVKARVFAAGGREVSEIAGSSSLFNPNPTADKSAQSVADSLTRVMQSDTTGVTRQLEVNDRSGIGLAGYTQQELRTEAGQKTLGGFVATLQTGPNHNQSPTAYIEQKTPNGEYANAHSLGYMSGAIQAGIGKLQASNKEKADMIGNIFSTVVGLVSGKAGELGGKAIDFITERAVDDAKTAYLSGSDLTTTWDSLAYPTDPKTQQPYAGPAQDSYDTAENRVITQAGR